MTVINDTLRFLVERKLWPLAILLLVAAVAVPMLLSKDPAPAAPAAAAVKSDHSTLATEPIVALASEGDRAGRRHVLGTPKDPFKPNATPTPTPKPKATPKAASAASGDAGPTAAPGGTTAPAVTSPVAPVTPQKPKTYEAYEMTVRFGSSETDRAARKDVKRLQALPSSDNPILIYLGVLKDKKTAVFLLDSGIVGEGDGTCMPSRTICATIHLKEGETEFFDVPAEDPGDGTAAPESGAQYQLDVIKIRKLVTTSAKQAKQSRARVSAGGRMILKARIAGDGPLRYKFNQRTGQLEKLSRKAYKATVAKAARAARAHF
jgi:hypothetical protein